MPNITDTPPAPVQADLDRLRAHLDATLPKKNPDKNIHLATWNLRAFGGLTKKWANDPGDSPQRNFHAIVCIAEILSRFDVIAIQEVKGDLRALRHLLKALGDRWGFLMTDVAGGDPGNDERMAFLFDTERVKPSGLACELVLPEVARHGIPDPANTFQRQFARTPYAVSFLSSGATFIMVTLHVVYGSGSSTEDRKDELTAIAKWLAGWATDVKAYNHNLIALGDFNIDRVDDPLYDAFTSTGLFTPPDLNAVPRTIFAKPGEPQKDKHYDQIAWFNTAAGIPKLSLNYVKGGFVDFRGEVMTDLTMESLSWRMSDHFPLWAEFKA
ncbi:MAG: endonuclease/exonuclease/phosphatase family protein [Acidobacteriota bacterium]